jgi:hypothetical protein
MEGDRLLQWTGKDEVTAETEQNGHHAEHDDQDAPNCRPDEQHVDTKKRNERPNNQKSKIENYPQSGRHGFASMKESQTSPAVTARKILQTDE